MSSIIPPVNEMDPDIFSFSIGILFVNFKDSVLVKVTVSFLVSIDGEDISFSFCVFSILSCSLSIVGGGGAKNIDHIINTNADKEIAKIRFLPSILFFFSLCV